MLKRIPAMLVLVIYLVTSTGFAINLHYCGAKVSAISIDKKVSCCAKTKKAMKCCHDRNVQIKVSSKHVQAEKTTTAPPLTGELILNRILAFFFLDLSPQPKSQATANAPPADQGVPIFLQNQVFRI